MANVRNLIYDLGCHNGQDSDFCLKKGFTVFAVEANPELCDVLKLRFLEENVTPPAISRPKRLESASAR